ncbi:MAG TPA: VOC family protein [Acidimicrobiia bacterium]|nr:VOC family protein [Acidimicrobiia bacterium]
MADRYDLDHVALAADDTSDALRFLTGTLGGTVLFGGQAVGFRPMQVWVGTPDGVGMKVELLEPWAVERNDFLARFIKGRGPGPHHLTYKVPDLVDTVARFRANGYGPVQIDVSDPEWKEAFLLPREAHGTVVQLAQYDGDFATRAELVAHAAKHGPDEHPRWWVDPVPANGAPACLRRVVIRTPALAAATAFFAGMLQGDVEHEDDTTVDFVWPHGSRVRLEARTDAAPGVDRLEVDGLRESVTLIGTTFQPGS